MIDFNPERTRSYEENTPLTEKELTERRQAAKDARANNRKNTIKRSAALFAIGTGAWAIGKIFGPDAASIPENQNRTDVVSMVKELKNAPLDTVGLEEIVSIAPGERESFLISACIKNPNVKLPEGAPECKDLINNTDVDLIADIYDRDYSLPGMPPTDPAESIITFEEGVKACINGYSAIGNRILDCDTILDMESITNEARGVILQPPTSPDMPTLD